MAEDSRDNKLKFSLKELTLEATSSQSASKDANDVGVPGSSATLQLPDCKFVCVEYPAVVSNVDRMLESVGGEKGVSKTYADSSRRLELRFRPQDPFCHSLCGNRFPSTNLLLRVRRRVRKGNPEDVQIEMGILGVIGTTYKFQGMADFQYLAVHSEDGKHLSLYDKIILRKPESKQYFEQPVPFYIPPPIFSRLDNPVDYFYRPDIHHNQVPMSKDNFIGLNRARRPHNALFISYDEPTVPSECAEAARANWDRVCQKPCDKEAEEAIGKMFESRPIWSRNAVKANLDIHPEKLKLLLPVVAYYMVTGPWRSLWVRLGYDPRKNPEAKKYQVLDFRIRCSTKHGYSVSDMPVKAKRSTLNYSLSITFNKAAPQPASVMELPPDGTSEKSVPIKYQLKESSYIFREGMLPPHRQMFYQLCDIEVESVRKVIQRNDGEEEVCDERDGWCLPHTADNLRDIVSTMIKKVIREQRPAW
ncbi:general transcription factor 3C polypeptide 5 [Aplochiton taeniatus]